MKPQGTYQGRVTWLGNLMLQLPAALWKGKEFTGDQVRNYVGKSLIAVGYVIEVSERYWLIHYPYMDVVDVLEEIGPEYAGRAYHRGQLVAEFWLYRPK